MKHCQLSCIDGPCVALARTDACVDRCRWPYNERQGRMHTVPGLNGVAPLFMSQDVVVPNKRGAVIMSSLSVLCPPPHGVALTPPVSCTGIYFVQK